MLRAVGTFFLAFASELVRLRRVLKTTDWRAALTWSLSNFTLSIILRESSVLSQHYSIYKLFACLLRRLVDRGSPLRTYMRDGETRQEYTGCRAYPGSVYGILYETSREIDEGRDSPTCRRLEN
jgi:hypothetical protein